ncbi:MAG: hypothetical protein IT228_05020 [Flavobacteriales bacterium]|nr:hypothetical protein [Flavobacteriales bacterium]MCC6576686.1 hypothetical protein [Flavobacteriales bacterium]NUQ15193.1 hypothetical protein [Flavobacteriales bacterium]
MPGFALLPMLVLLQTAPAGPVRWQFEATTGPEGRVEVSLQATLEAGWHLYALELPREDGPLPTVVRLVPGEGHEGLLEVHEPTPVEEMDPNFAMVVRHHSGEPVFRAVTKRTTDQAFRLTGEVEYMLCNDRTCLPPVAVPFTLEVPAATN